MEGIPHYFPRSPLKHRRGQLPRVLLQCRTAFGRPDGRVCARYAAEECFLSPPRIAKGPSWGQKAEST